MSEDSEIESAANAEETNEDSAKLEKMLKESQNESAPDDSMRVELKPLVEDDNIDTYYLNEDRFLFF